MNVGLGADYLADAYHGIPNCPTQLGLCVVAIMNPESKIIQFQISFTHLFGLSAAVVNFNRLPELLTAVCRRIGACPTWHLFDDQGCLEFETSPAEPRPARTRRDELTRIDQQSLQIGRKTFQITETPEGSPQTGPPRPPE